MSKTNFDDIELAEPGIEAGEINSEAATAGQVLTADGAGGVGWQTHGFVNHVVSEVIYVEEGGDVAWTDLGLTAEGVPAEATAVLLGVRVQDVSINARISFRPYGSGWSASAIFAPSFVSISTAEVKATVIVPCGAGKVEYNVDASGSDTAYYSVHLLGYWL